MQIASERTTTKTPAPFLIGVAFSRSNTYQRKRQLKAFAAGYNAEAPPFDFDLIEHHAAGNRARGWMCGQMDRTVAELLGPEPVKVVVDEEGWPRLAAAKRKCHDC